MTDDLPDTRDPIRRIATDFGATATPLSITGTPDFGAFCAVADEIADEIEHAVRGEVPA